MTGSLDNPPVVVKQAQGQLLLACAVVLALTIGVLIPAYNTPDKLGFYALLLFLLLGVAFFAFLYRRPALLTIAPDGITWRTAFRTNHYEWWQLHQFYVGSTGYGTTVMFRYQKKREGAVWPGSFGTLWELRPKPLCDVLHKAQEKWGQQAASQNS
jgi:hypothetical protein